MLRRLLMRAVALAVPLAGIALLGEVARTVRFLWEHVGARPFRVEWLAVGAASGCDAGACATTVGAATLAALVLWSAAALVGFCAWRRPGLLVAFVWLVAAPAALHVAVHALWLARSPHFGIVEGVRYVRQLALVSLALTSPALLALLVRRLAREEPAKAPT